jgi:tRNA G18 (ribose-2'-O)-methylase SpoU
MEHVTDLEDPRLEYYRRLSQPNSIRDAGLFVVEGRLVVRRLLLSPQWRTQSVLLTETAHAALSDTLAQASPAPQVFVVSQEVMNAITGFNIHRGCLALADRPASRSLNDLDLTTVGRLVILEGVNNPDNIGGIFRSAAAFGIDAIVLGPNCSDPLYRKAVRTSMGAVLTVPFVDAGAWPEALACLRGRRIRLLAFTPDATARPLGVIARTTPQVALLFGAEGEGLSQEALAVADDRVMIPMAPATDSLNVTMAASIALYHFFPRA